MENLRIRAGQAKQTLADIKESIRQQRLQLDRVGGSQALADQMKCWEATLQQLQTEMLLEKSAQLSTLYEVSHTINATLDWRATLQAVMDAVIRITEAERGLLMLLCDEGVLRPEVMSNATHEEFTEADLRLSRSVVEQALQRRRPILTTNAQIDPRFQGSESIVAYGLRAILCAPLVYQDELLGVIYLDNRARAGVFTQEDLTMLAAFARQAAVAIANAREHRQTDQALAERVRQLTILQEMARDLNTSLKFERVMERSVSWAVAAASAEAGAIAILAEEGLRWVKSLGSIEPNTELATRCITKKMPLTTSSALALPLLCDERPVGALLLESPQHNMGTEGLDFVMRVADNAAIAVENARLYEALRQANDAKSEFISTVSHELRTPMTSIRGYADMLSKGMVGQLTPQQQEFVEAIRRNTYRMHILVSDLLDISRIETGRLKLAPKPVSFDSIIQEALHTVEELREEKQQEVYVHLSGELPKAYADPDRLTQVLINLLTNAIKYTPAHGRVEIKVWLPEDEPGYIHCAVKDNGIGIAMEDQARLFTKFYRVDNPLVREQPGSGLGLAITKSLIEIQGGRIWFESTLGKGTTFSFAVPVARPCP